MRHAGLVRRALERGFYQGWDLHPAQLVTRYVATYAFFRAALPAAAVRLDAYVNKVASAVRMKHIPTGISVFINGRDQHQNRVEARKIITAKVNQIKRAKEDADYAAFLKRLESSGVTKR